MAVIASRDSNVLACRAHMLRSHMSTLMRISGYMARIAGAYPALIRWYLGNRLRRLTVQGEYFLRRDGWSAMPRSISFRPTFLCNARCKMCSYANSIDPDTLHPITDGRVMMDLETSCRLADAAAPSHTMISVTGGEPLIWGDRLWDFLDYCRARGVPTSVTTNGILLDRYLDRLRVSPPDVLVLSLHGPEEVHNGIVGTPAFARITAACRALADCNAGNVLAPPLLLTNTVLLPENVGVLAEVVGISRQIGAVSANFQPLWIATEQMHRAHEEEADDYDRRFTAGHEVNPAQMDSRQVWQAMQSLRLLAGQLGHPVTFYPRLREREVSVYFECPERPVGRSRALCTHLIGQVLPDGTVSPCLGHSVGNIHDADFRDIWNGDAMREFRLRLKSARMFPICSRCCFLWRNE